MATFPPITHVAVTVTDLERSTRWYGELLASSVPRDAVDAAVAGPAFQKSGGTCYNLHGADVTAVITTSELTKQAREYARNSAARSFPIPR